MTRRLLGEWNWWLPSWLAWLPYVTIEGDVAEVAGIAGDDHRDVIPARA